jgi:signal transduction histidine kinase
LRLTQRLLLGSLIIVSVLVACVVGVIEYRLNARIADATTQALVREARDDVYIIGFFALAVAAAIAFLFARAVTRPVIELRDVARALAAGDLTRRPALGAPGEVGDLAIAIHRLAEQLSGRLSALEEEESLLTALLDSLNEGVMAIDARQRVVRINAIGKRLLRVRDPVPFTLDRLPRERVLREAVAAALSGTVTESIETFIDGRNLSLSARPLARGGAVLALLDLTPTRRLETIRRDFVANVSHELKTPLTSVGGFAETLLDDALPAPQRKQFAETILTNTRRMQRIVDDLLDLSRIESGGWVPNPQMVDVASVAADATTRAKSVADEKNVVLDVEIHDNAREAYADPTALRQVLSNLAENAIRHTFSGRVTVFTDPEENGVWVGVKDTGIGIAAEHLPRIFERFYRADRARSRDEGGTGLGLAIVRHLVEAHGGSVKAESQPGRGTTVSAFFPSA